MCMMVMLIGCVSELDLEDEEDGRVNQRSLPCLAGIHQAGGQCKRRVECQSNNKNIIKEGETTKRSSKKVILSLSDDNRLNASFRQQ